MAARNSMHRTIGTTPSRSRQIALASAYLGIDGEAFIQSSISASLLSMAEHDPTFGLALARSAGVDWDDLERITAKRDNDGPQS